MDSENNKYWYIKIGGYISMIMCILLAGIAIKNYFDLKDFIKNSKVVNGVVTQNAIHGTGTLVQYVSFIEYRVNNKIYECHNSRYRSNYVFEVGDTVEIRYEIKNPEKASVNNNENLYWSSKDLLVFDIIFLIIGVFGIFFTEFLVKISKNIETY